jgi:hypothetical protein
MQNAFRQEAAGVPPDEVRHGRISWQKRPENYWPAFSPFDGERDERSAQTRRGCFARLLSRPVYVLRPKNIAQKKW